MFLSMTMLEAIEARHSVRKYKDQPIPDGVLEILRDKIREINEIGKLHVHLVTEEPKAYKGIMAYGQFSGVRNYFIMAGKKADDLDERIGYYGEQLVLLAQTLGLNTCWTGMSYSKVSGTYELASGEKIGCYIALGYGETQGVSHKIKSASDVSNASDLTPQWFNKGIKAALLAPTAVNQQKFRIEYIGSNKVSAKPTFTMIGYGKMDLGIVKYHFELGAGKEHFEWV